jgi:hypothetical protein
MITLHQFTNNLYWMRYCTESQWSDMRTGVMWSCFLLRVINLAAIFWTRCNFEIMMYIYSIQQLKRCHSPNVTLQASKLILCTHLRVKEFSECCLSFDGTIVTNASFVKNLGIFFDRTLCMQLQSCYFQIRNIERNRSWLIKTDKFFKIYRSLAMKNYESA